MRTRATLVPATTHQRNVQRPYKRSDLVPFSVDRTCQIIRRITAECHSCQLHRVDGGPPLLVPRRPDGPCEAVPITRVGRDLPAASNARGVFPHSMHPTGPTGMPLQPYDIITVRKPSTSCSHSNWLARPSVTARFPRWMKVVPEWLTILIHSLPVRQQIDSQVAEC